jgi:predicted DNA-binding transcriptional regulator YafY
MNSATLPSAITESSTTQTQPLEEALRRAQPANDPAPDERQPVLLRRAARAIEQRRVCVIRYASEPGGASCTRSVEPLAVVSTRGALGLLAWCHLRRDLRTFRLDRVASLTLTDERFGDHPGLALERFIQRRRRALP